MKNVYILTFADSPNYGAILQAYSLKCYITSLGNNALVINYTNPRRKYCQVHGYKKVRSVLWNTTIGRFFADKKRKKRTQIFKQQYLELTSCIYKNENQLKLLNKEADAFIVGSDQVWSVNNNNNDPSFLLSFANNTKRISYAASFGTNVVNDEYLLQNQNLFKRFDAISVREIEGANILQNVLGIKPEVLVDPVFLTSKEEWIKRLQLNDHKTNDYILCYVMPGNKQLEQKIYSVAHELAVLYGAKILTIGKKPYSKGIGDEKLLNGCGPKEFLELILNAKYIVTNSFHGTAFSIVFNKQFYTVMNDSNKVNRNSRMENLLTLFGLNKRGVYLGNHVSDQEELDFDNVNQIIESEKIRSEKFLSEAIGD